MASLKEYESISANLNAFLDLIAYSEGTAYIGDQDGYNVLVGSTPKHPILFDDYSHHPNILNHALDSTAAGRGQIIHGTWERVAAKLGLRDFGPENQDRAMRELVKEREALEDVEAGRIADAIHKCCEEWASFPGGDSGQHENQLDTLLATYRTLGGTIAAEAS